MAFFNLSFFCFSISSGVSSLASGLITISGLPNLLVPYIILLDLKVLYTSSCMSTQHYLAVGDWEFHCHNKSPPPCSPPSSPLSSCPPRGRIKKTKPPLRENLFDGFTKKINRLSRPLFSFLDCLPSSWQISVLVTKNKSITEVLPTHTANQRKESSPSSGLLSFLPGSDWSGALIER